MFGLFESGRLTQVLLYPQIRCSLTKLAVNAHFNVNRASNLYDCMYLSIHFMVKSGKFGHRVNSDTHLQT